MNTAGSCQCRRKQFRALRELTQLCRSCVRARADAREIHLDCALRWHVVPLVGEHALPIRDLLSYLIPQEGKASCVAPVALCFPAHST